MKKLFFLLLIAVVFALQSCSTSQVVKLSKTQNLVFLDSLAASEAILDDDTEHYFERVGMLDMGIQMKEKINENANRGYVLAQYQNYLRRDVSSFTGAERKLIGDQMAKVYQDITKICPELLPSEIQLIKTHGKHYGPGVYYTRENRIVIPADALVTKGRKSADVEESLYHTLTHEVFHIISRYNERTRRKLYSLIGFRNIFSFPLEIEPATQKRLLLNPDGLDLNQVIEISTPEGITVSAVPLTISSEPAFNEARHSFLNYMQFDLFQVYGKGKVLQVISNEDGGSTINYKEYPSFFEKIKDNTQYIIHPDEIMAENFVLLVGSQRESRLTAKLSAPGKQLLQDMKIVLQEKL